MIKSLNDLIYTLWYSYNPFVWIYRYAKISKWYNVWSKQMPEGFKMPEANNSDNDLKCLKQIIS